MWADSEKDRKKTSIVWLHAIRRKEVSLSCLTAAMTKQNKAQDQRLLLAVWLSSVEIYIQDDCMVRCCKLQQCRRADNKAFIMTDSVHGMENASVQWRCVTLALYSYFHKTNTIGNAKVKIKWSYDKQKVNITHQSTERNLNVS